MGVWNGWGYGIAIFRALNFQISEPEVWRKKCRFSKCRFSVLNLKFDFISDGGCTREKQIQKALGSLPPCRNRCRFSESAICSSRVRPPSEIKSNFNSAEFQGVSWEIRPLKNIFSDSGKWPFHTPPIHTPTKCRPISTPCEMRFLPREKGETAFVEGFSLTKAVSPFSHGKNRISQGVENRGSLISVPLALRERKMRQIKAQHLVKSPYFSLLSLVSCCFFQGTLKVTDLR